MKSLKLKIRVLYQTIINTEHKKLAVLIDPDKQKGTDLPIIVKNAEKNGADFLLIGGSLMFSDIHSAINTIKHHTDLPVILFPGSVLQLSEKADGILLLSLISGRNPEFLIGNQVIAAPLLKRSKIEVISTGYILVDGGNQTSVEYMSNTKPIPYEKPEIAVATAIAGELIGHKLIYLEAGSGAKNHVSTEMIQQVKKNIEIPLIVGGGIKTLKSVEDVCDAGADIIVVGTAFEKNIDLIKEFSEKIHSY